MNEPDEMIRTARRLGYAGLIPFALGLVLMVLADDPMRGHFGSRLLIAYGAVILSFLGAVHWGWCLRDAGLTAPPGPQLAWAVMPALFAWVSLLLPTKTGLLLQAAAFLAAYGVDRTRLRGEPLWTWYGPLRLNLTIGAAGLLFAGALLY